MSNQKVNSQTCAYAYLDFDINAHRQKFSTAAAFVDATDTRYGHSSKDLLCLGGSELSRLGELIDNDHEWSDRARGLGGIEVRPQKSGSRIVVKLYWDVAPLACENFATLCLNGGKLPSADNEDIKSSKKVKPAPMGESGKPLSYRNSTVHRIVPGFIVQAGDFVFGNGSGGESIYNGKKFKDERAGLALKHDRRGILSMGNSGKNSNTSQFFFTFNKAPQCDGKHVIFGEIISGYEVLDALEEVGSKDGTPSSAVTITDCGIYRPLETPSAGFWFDKPDADSFGGTTPVFVVQPRVALVVPSQAAEAKFVSALEERCSICACLVDEGGTAQKVAELIERFSVDVVVVAPACCALVDGIVEPPTLWIETSSIGSEIGISEIILKAKPIEALSVIESMSWIARKRGEWKLHGL
mmetsp:Transcript_26632/g.57791  ORF Transcript_26632/g.57791 Transcript_26632/m.57791 type:complete len:412 (+) Transcript_26632:145-1380(+)